MPPGHTFAHEHSNAHALETPQEHEQHLTTFEQQAEQDLLTHSYHKFFEDLTKLQAAEKANGGDFAKDLKEIDKHLHTDGFLPGIDIVTDAQGNINMVATGEQLPAQAPTHYAPPKGGYNSHGGNYGGGSAGYGGQHGFGGDVGGDGGMVSHSGSSEGSSMPSSGPGSFNSYDGDDGDEDSEQQAAVAMAEQDQGKEMWTNFPAADAKEGCAASVSQILDDAGVAHLTPGQGDALCTTMQKDLMAQGWTVTDKPQPGDVVIGYGGLSSAHTGIVGKNNTVFDNHSSTGKLSQDSLSYFSNWNKVVFLKPPATKGA